MVIESFDDDVLAGGLAQVRHARLGNQNGVFRMHAAPWVLM